MFLIKSLAMPLVWVLLLLILGLVLVRFSRRKAAKIGWYSVLLATLILLVFSFPPFANVLTHSLESQVPIATEAELSTLDVIVVLGGGGYPSGGFRRQAELAERSYPRLCHGVRIFQQGHARFLAFCGGELRERVVRNILYTTNPLLGVFVGIESERRTVASARVVEPTAFLYYNCRMAGTPGLCTLSCDSACARTPWLPG